MGVLDIILGLAGIVALAMVIVGALNVGRSGEERLKWLLFIAVGIFTLLNLVLYWAGPVPAL